VDAVNILEGSGYYQKDRSVEEYVDEFRMLISEAGYTDGRVIVIKFRRGLRTAIQTQVATATDRPEDHNYKAWYEAAKRIDRARRASF